jgi:hypothetical protein
MKHVALGLSLLLLTACAHSSSTYLGNGLHEINAGGGAYTSNAKVREAFVKEAFDTCAAENKGFEILSSEDTSQHGAIANTNGNAQTAVYGGNGSAYANTNYSGQTIVTPYTKPGSRAVIRCAGEMDPVLVRKYRETSLSPASVPANN